MSVFGKDVVILSSHIFYYGRSQNLSILAIQNYEKNQCVLAICKGNSLGTSSMLTNILKD